MTAGRLPARRSYGSAIELIGDDWSSGSLRWVVRARDRLWGLRHGPTRAGLLLAGRSVHGVGMARPLKVVFIDGDGRVVGVAALRPGGVAVHRRARFVAELPWRCPAPPPGAVLTARRPR